MPRLDEPPESGLLQIEVPAAPVSFQATAPKKAVIIAAVRAAIASCAFLLGGDVKIQIRWGISVRARYETDSSADVDNIVKPILDALSGPDGILIDDCQVQELTCYWSGGYTTPVQQHLEIEIQFDPEAWFSKQGLIFLEIDRSLYLPVGGELGIEITVEQAEYLVQRFESARRMVAAGATPYQAHLSLPAQRVFHRSKLGAFRLATLDELRNRLGGEG